MALWRVHVELEDRPGRLGELATAIGATGCNILSVHVVGEPTDAGSITDELLVRVPQGIDPSVLIMAAARIGAPCTLHVPADATELADSVTTALALARMVAADAGSAARAVASLLNARLVDPNAPRTAGLHTHPLRIGAQYLLLGRAWPFTATELSRASALLELAAQLSWRAPAGDGLGHDRVLLLQDGAEVVLRAAGPADAPLVAALHARCSPESRRARFLSPTPRLSGEQLRALVGPEGGRAVLALTTDGGSAVGLADLHAGARSGGTAPTAGFGVLVEDTWQHRGLGTALVRRIAETAVEDGVAELTGTVYAGSVLTEQPPPGGVGSSDTIEVRITRLLRRAGLRPSAVSTGGTVRLRVPLAAAAMA